jgi:AcrR family transcriptional regulator
MGRRLVAGQVAERKDGGGSRRRRANGEESRRRILDAAVEVAGSRGYEGTSIGLVSDLCGLPASSIYWHFKDKDDLIAAVIERSFTTWIGAVSLPDEGTGTPLEQAVALGGQVARAQLEAPEYLRLGLMLALEHRPEEPSARTMFLQARRISYTQVAAAIHRFFPTLDDASVALLATYAIAAADGLFIAKEIGPDSVDLIQMFELHARVMIDTAIRLAAAQGPPG